MRLTKPCFTPVSDAEMMPEQAAALELFGASGCNGLNISGP